MNEKPWLMPYHVEKTASGLLVASVQPLAPTYGPSPLSGAYEAFVNATAVSKTAWQNLTLEGIKESLEKCKEAVKINVPLTPGKEPKYCSLKDIENLFLPPMLYGCPVFGVYESPVFHGGTEEKLPLWIKENRGQVAKDLDTASAEFETAIDNTAAGRWASECA